MESEGTKPDRAEHDPTIDIRLAVDALLERRGVPHIDGPAAAIFWAGGERGAWHKYTQFANGQMQPAGAPRVRDRSLKDIEALIANAVLTFGILLDNRDALGEPMPCAVVWRVRPEIGSESDGAQFWRARCALVPLADAASCALGPPDCVDLVPTGGTFNDCPRHPSETESFKIGGVDGGRRCTHPGCYWAVTPRLPLDDFSTENMTVISREHAGDCACETCVARRYARAHSRWNKLLARAAEPPDAATADERRAIHVLFATATIVDMKPQCDLNEASLAEAKHMAGSAGYLIAAEELGTFIGVIQLGGGVGCPYMLVPATVLGSPHAWALISSDGKRAVVGMRDGK